MYFSSISGRKSLETLNSLFPANASNATAAFPPPSPPYDFRSLPAIIAVFPVSFPETVALPQNMRYDISKIFCSISAMHFQAFSGSKTQKLNLSKVTNYDRLSYRSPSDPAGFPELPPDHQGTLPQNGQRIFSGSAEFFPVPEATP